MDAARREASNDASASQQIDAIVAGLAGWRGARLSELRSVIRAADPGIVEEVKWKKPSNPAGVPVWSCQGIVCIGEALKNAVRLTFPKGAAITSARALFNARLDSTSVRAVDFREGDGIDEHAVTVAVREAIRLNASKVPRR